MTVEVTVTVHSVNFGVGAASSFGARRAMPTLSLPICRISNWTRGELSGLSPQSQASSWAMNSDNRPDRIASESAKCLIGRITTHSVKRVDTYPYLAVELTPDSYYVAQWRLCGAKVLHCLFLCLFLPLRNRAQVRCYVGNATKICQ